MEQGVVACRETAVAIHFAAEYDVGRMGKQGWTFVPICSSIGEVRVLLYALFSGVWNV